MILQRTVRYLYLRFIRIRRDPREIARGLAIGVFVGFSPFFGFHMILALALAALLKGSKFAAVLGTWVWNPFLLLLEYKVGCWVLGIGPGHLRPLSLEPREILNASWNVLFPLSIGSFLLGLSAALPAYFLSNAVVRRMQERRLRRKYNR